MDIFSFVQKNLATLMSWKPWHLHNPRTFLQGRSAQMLGRIPVFSGSPPSGVPPPRGGDVGSERHSPCPHSWHRGSGPDCRGLSLLHTLPFLVVAVVAASWSKIT